MSGDGQVFGHSVRGLLESGNVAGKGPANVTSHPEDNMRASGTSQSGHPLRMPPDSDGILRGGPPLEGAICPDVVTRVVHVSEHLTTSTTVAGK